MSPFRDAPQVELGPLDVGLEVAAARAMARLPRGGRVIGLGSGRGFSHVVGAVGSAGVLGFVAAALVAWSTGWRPASLGDLALAAGAIVLGGASLAAVLSALDHDGPAISRRGDLVGGRARSVLRRMTRLAIVIRRGKVNAGRAGALRRALAAASDPDLARWIPRDVRGRAELLLARTVAATAGPALTAPARREIRALLAAAAERLDHPAPAEADLAAMDRTPLRVSPPQRIAGDLAEPVTLPPGHLDPPCPPGQAAAIADEPRATMRL